MINRSAIVRVNLKLS